MSTLLSLLVINIVLCLFSAGYELEQDLKQYKLNAPGQLEFYSLKIIILGKSFADISFLSMKAVALTFQK